MKRLLPALVAAILLTAGCAEPVPTGKRHYVGTWEGENTGLVIRPNGTLAWSHKEGSTQTSVNGPIKRFEDNDIVVGIGWFTTTFDVSVPPRLENGEWIMVVDDVRLTRTGSFDVPDKAPAPGEPTTI